MTVGRKMTMHRAIPERDLVYVLHQTAHKAAALPTSPAAVARRLRQSPSLTLPEALAIWRARDERWQHSISLFRIFAQTVIRLGEPLLAYDIIREGLQRRPADLRLRELQGLALAKSGATERAIAVLEKLRAEGSATVQTLGILARAYKDLADDAVDQSASERRHLILAADTYLSAFEIKGDYWTGINAATTALLLNRRATANRLANNLRRQCMRRLRLAPQERYWLEATIAEASLVLGDWAEANKWYAQAAKHGAGRIGDLQSTRRNARMLLRYWQRDQPELEAVLRLPNVVVFTGHMIDRSTGGSARFPRQLESAVAAEIRGKLDTLHAGIGYSSAACGSDILFLEAMIARRAEVTIVLPTDAEVFKPESVDVTGPAGRWGERFDRVLAAASRVIVASTTATANSTLFDYANDLLLGMGMIRARQLDAKPIGMAVWDGLRGQGAGGTATAVRAWRKRGIPLEIIDPLQLNGRNRRQVRQRPPVKKRHAGSRVGGVKVMSLLFADAVGFSKLTEPQIPVFVKHVLGRIARLATASPEIAAKNTWGDGLYFVFRTAEAAADFALDMAQLIASYDWKKIGLPETLSMRIALHTGPVYEFYDPIVGQNSFGGTHVSRAARIEPITPPGQVYASEAFACLALAHGVELVAFDYAGHTPMAKNFGTFPTYHVRRKQRLRDSRLC